MGNLYSRIESLCKRQGINITEMCKRSGAARSSLTDLKKGRINGLNSSTLTKIATYFDVPIEFLLVGNQHIDVVLDQKSEKKEPTVTMDDELSKKKLMLIDFARSVPADKVDFALKLMQTIAEADE